MLLEVVFDSCLLDIRLVWKGFVNIPFHGGPYSLIHLPRILGCEHMEHKQIECSLYFALHGVPGHPHQVFVSERGGGVLDMNGMRLWNPSHD